MTKKRRGCILSLSMLTDFTVMCWTMRANAKKLLMNRTELSTFIFEPPHDKMACPPSEDSDQPWHPPSLIRVLAVRVKKPWVLSYPLSAQRRLWSDWADVQADLSLRWAHRSVCWFCHEAAHLYCLISSSRGSVRLYGKIILERQRVNYRPYRRTNYTLTSLLHLYTSAPYITRYLMLNFWC